MGALGKPHAPLVPVSFVLPRLHIWPINLVVFEGLRTYVWEV